MTNQLSDIRRLLPILDVAYQAEQFRMSKINARIKQLQDTLKDIDNHDALSNSEISPAIRAGADIRWQAWVQERRTLINREIAGAMAERESVMLQLKTALAKLEAAKQVEARAAQDARQIRSRRSSW